MRLLRQTRLILFYFMASVVFGLLWLFATYQDIRSLLLKNRCAGTTTHRSCVPRNTVRGVRRTTHLIIGTSYLTQATACLAVPYWRLVPSIDNLALRKEYGGVALRARAWLVWDDKSVLERVREFSKNFCRVQTPKFNPKS